MKYMECVRSSMLKRCEHVLNVRREGPITLEQSQGWDEIRVPGRGLQLVHLEVGDLTFRRVHW